MFCPGKYAPVGLGSRSCSPVINWTRENRPARKRKLFPPKTINSTNFSVLKQNLKNLVFSFVQNLNGAYHRVIELIGRSEDSPVLLLIFGSGLGPILYQA